MKDNLTTLLDCGCSHCRDWKKRIIAEIHENLNRKRYAKKGYCPIWDNAYDYALKEFLGE